MKLRILLVAALGTFAAGALVFAAKTRFTTRAVQATNATLTAQEAELRARLTAAREREVTFTRELAARKAASAATLAAALPATADAARRDRATAVAPAKTGARDAQTYEAQKRDAILEALAIARVHRLVALETNLRPFFDSLGLSPAQWDEFEKLTLERHDLERIAANAARARGANQTKVRAAQSAAGAEIDAKLEALVGAPALHQLREFQHSAPLRNATLALAHQLLFSNDPLTPAQARQVSDLLSRQSAESISSVGLIPNDDTLAKAATFLTDPQIAAWRRLQSAQTLARRLTDLARWENGPVR